MRWEKKQGSLRKAGPEYCFDCFAEDSEVDLVINGQHEDLVLVVLLPFVAHTSFSDSLLLNNVGKTASVGASKLRPFSNS